MPPVFELYYVDSQGQEHELSAIVADSAQEVQQSKGIPFLRATVGDEEAGEWDRRGRLVRLAQ